MSNGCVDLTTSAYCSLPPFDVVWLEELSANRKWSLHYPLIELDIRNNTNCTFDTQITLNRARICSYGFTFLLECFCGLALVLISAACLFKLQKTFPNRQWQRKSMFALLLCVGIIRSVLNIIASHEIMSITTLWNLLITQEGKSITDWFLRTTIPVNSVSDVLVAQVDFSVTSFWLDVLFHRFAQSRTAAVWRVVLLVAVAGIFSTLLRMDFVQVIDQHDFNGGNVFYRTFIFVACIHAIFGLGHMCVVALLFYTMFFSEARAISSLQNATMRRNLCLLASVGLVSAACLLIRSIALLGRVIGNEAFTTGSLSFDNPVFTTIYFVVLMNVPCLAVAVAFALLTFKLHVDNDADAHPLEQLTDARDALIAAFTTEGTRTLPIFLNEDSQPKAYHSVNARASSLEN